MITTNVQQLKINKLTQEQYNKALSEGRINASELYLTPDNGSGVSAEELHIGPGSGTDSVQQIRDAELSNDSFDFTDKNPNAIVVAQNLIGAGQMPMIDIAAIPFGAIGNNSVALNGKSAAVGKRSFTSGANTISFGQYSHTEGDSNVVFGDSGHAEGYRTTAVGFAAHAGGQNTVARGASSFASGSYTEATYDNSVAFGRYTVTTQANQTVVGRFNAETEASEDALFLVGQGTYDGNRSNAFKVVGYQNTTYGKPEAFIGTRAVATIAGGPFTNAQGCFVTIDENGDLVATRISQGGSF